jgi:hypothetical protein
MGTNGVVMRSMPDQTYQAIRFSYDGYMSHQGPMLVNGYSTPDKVDRLFAVCGNGLHLQENPDHLDVDEGDDMFDFDLGRMTRDEARSIVADYNMAPEDNPGPYDTYVCFHHNGAWHAAFGTAAFDAIEAGDTSYVLNTASLIAWSNGELTAADFVAQPATALGSNERQGFLRVQPDGTVSLETGGEHWGLTWDDAIEDQLVALVDQEVVIRTGMMASSAGSDAQGNFVCTVTVEVTKIRAA